MNTDDPVGRKVADELNRMFFGGSPKPARAKPHRCIDCQRVTRHVRCDECRKKRSAS